jgi:hypothetical protein
MARETIELLLDVNNTYQQISGANQLTEQTARFYDRIAGIVCPLADQIFAPDINLPFHQWSPGRHPGPVDHSRPEQLHSTVSHSSICIGVLPYMTDINLFTCV